MLESIEIKNFRCFKETKVSKFALVNLFGGLNNSGKTTLLEAIYLIKNPHVDVIRKEENAFVTEMPLNAWNNWFYKQNKEKEISLYVIDDKNDKYETVLKNEEDFDNKDEQIRQSDSFITKTKLRFDAYKNSEKEYSVTLIASKEGVECVPNIERTNLVHFISASTILSNSDLSKEYDKARSSEKDDILLKALQVADSTIEKIGIFTIGSPILYLQRRNEPKLPITLFGDAINKIVIFILTIINNPNTTILIDEIENGIHYTKQAELWEMLFKLAIEFNVQIFATSHSLEMIKAFAKIAQQFPEKAAYFEMARDYETQDIIATSIPIDILEYDIENNLRFRGE